MRGQAVAEIDARDEGVHPRAAAFVLTREPVRVKRAEQSAKPETPGRSTTLMPYSRPTISNIPRTTLSSGK
jgi:hypothetical protein